jgi:glycosyl transferase family 25
MEHIDKIVFINLLKREDRRREIYEEFEKYNFPKEKILRFEAIETPHYGLIGCGKSHIELLKMAKENQWKNVLILEDDFQIIVSKEEFYQSLHYFFSNIHSQHSWDVLMFAYNIKNPSNYVKSFENDDRIGKIGYAQTASAYLVNQHYYDTLIDNLTVANEQLSKTGRHWDFANDVYWKVLQEKDTWLYFKNRLSIQRASFSDNGNKFTDYKV